MPPRKKLPKINLALQGGGSHGAFTWGVLDRLLEDERIQLEGVTGTSAGAMNGAVLVYGLLSGGRDGARQLLRDFWYKVSAAASFSPIQPTWFEKWLGQNDASQSPALIAADYFTRMFSPYQYNPLDINPLRTIVDELVDFELIRENTEYKLFVNATNVRSGKIKVFKTQEMSIECVMASACLPFIFQTVEIDGEAYWDGGYSGNPALFPLFYTCGSNDIMVVQINPLCIEDVPTDPADILDRVNEISFNSTLMREVRAIHFVKHLLDGHQVDDKRYSDIRLHLVEAENVMNDFNSASKLNADWDFLQYLHQIGYQSADEWLNEHAQDIGKRSSIDIEDIYL
ncbi:MAG: patatin-like phospholipase family protein [Rickettsiales bacterium]|nr:patatin-like phospholipase family protein [Rickettsiales bacterium]